MGLPEVNLSTEEQAWKSAQSVEISVDLIEAVKIQSAFVSEVDRNPCLYWNTEVIARAIQR